MIGNTKKYKPKGLVDNSIDSTKANLDKTINGVPYSPAAKEQMKRNINPDNSNVTQKTSQYKQFLHEKSSGGAMTDNYKDWNKLG